MQCECYTSTVRFPAIYTNASHVGLDSRAGEDDREKISPCSALANITRGRRISGCVSNLPCAIPGREIANDRSLDEARGHRKPTHQYAYKDARVVRRFLNGWSRHFCLLEDR